MPTPSFFFYFHHCVLAFSCIFRLLFFFSLLQGGRIIISEAGGEVSSKGGKKPRMSMATMSRGHNQVRVNRKTHEVMIKLARHYDESGERAPNEGFYRLRSMFPTADDHVLHTVRESEWNGH